MLGDHLPPTTGGVRLRIGGAGLTTPLELTGTDLAALPPRSQRADFHRVTTWSTQDLHRQGIAFRDLRGEVVVPRLGAGPRPLHLSATGGPVALAAPPPPRRR